MIEKLKNYFLEKICTIITNTPAIPIKSGVDHAQWFTGQVVDIDPTGIYIKNLKNATMSYFQFPIIGIAEEEFISDDDPKSKVIKNEIEKKNTPPEKKSDLISVDELTRKLRSIKK